MGLNCPLPVLKTRRKLSNLDVGAMLHVVATDPMSAIDIPHMCNQDGHTLLEVKMVDGVRHFKIRRGKVITHS